MKMNYRLQLMGKLPILPQSFENKNILKFPSQMKKKKKNKNRMCVLPTQCV